MYIHTSYSTNFSVQQQSHNGVFMPHPSDIVFQEVQGGFDRLRKAVRAGGKAHCSALSLNTSSSTPHHLPSPPVSHVFTPPTSNHMLLQNTPSGCSKSQSVFERHGDNRTQCPLTHFMVRMLVLTCRYIHVRICTCA